MELHVSLDRARGLAADVYEQVKRAILDGRLRPGQALPPTRELARRLSVARNTISNAYQRLIAEGYLVGRVGAGTFVNTAPLAHRRRPLSGTAIQPRKIWRSLVRETPPRSPVTYDFRIGTPDPDLFPWDEWRRRVAHQLRRRRRAAGYPPPEGDPSLRAAIARHVGISRGVHADAEDMLICSGAQQAFDLIGRVLVDPGASVAIEDPG